MWGECLCRHSASHTRVRTRRRPLSHARKAGAVSGSGVSRLDGLMLWNEDRKLYTFRNRGPF